MRISRSLLLVSLVQLAVISLLVCLSVHAETGVLSVHVTDCRDVPLKNITVGVANGASLTTRTDDGDLRLPISPLTHPGASVTLQLLSPALIMLSPWDHHTIVPAFDTSDFVHVVIAKRGDDQILHSASCLGSIARRLTIDPGAAQAAGLPGAATKESRLQLVAKDYGLPSDTIDQAIRSLSTSVSAESRALAELYTQQYDKASDDFATAENEAETDLHARQQHLATLFFGHAYTLYLAGRPLESEVLYKRAVDLDPDNPVFLNNYAVSLRVNGSYSRAEAMFRRVLVLQRPLWESDDVRLVPAMNNLAQTLLAENRTDEAENLFTSGLRIRRAKLKEHDIRIAYSEADLGALEAVLDRCTIALPLFEHAASFFNSPLTIWPEDDPKHNKTLQAGQRQQQSQGQSSTRPKLKAITAPPLPNTTAEMKMSATREMAGSIATGGSNLMAGSIPVTSDAIQRTRMNRIDSGQPGESRLLVSQASCTTDVIRRESLLRAALASAQAHFGDQHLETAYAMIALGAFDRQYNKSEEGQHLLREALEIYQHQLGPTNPEVISLQQETDHAP